MGSVISLSVADSTAPSRDSVVRARTLRVAPEPVSHSIDTDYWLAHCEGYRVDGAEGRIGFVDEIRQDTAEPDQMLLAVRMGMLGRRIALIPANAVELIVPRAGRIWLRTPTAIVDTEPLLSH